MNKIVFRLGILTFDFRKRPTFVVKPIPELYDALREVNGMKVVVFSFKLRSWLLLDFTFIQRQSILFRFRRDENFWRWGDGRANAKSPRLSGARRDRPSLRA